MHKEHRGKGFTIGAGFLGGAMIPAAVALEGSAQSAALAAGLMAAVCMTFSLRVLKLPPLSGPMLYLYVLSAFHLGVAVPWALDLPLSRSPGWITAPSLQPALILVLWALWCYQLGVIAAAAGSRPQETRRPPVRYNHPLLYHAGLLVVGVGLCAFLWGVRSLGFEALLDASYTETYRLTVWRDPRFFVASITFVPIGFYMAAAGAPRCLLRRVALLLSLWCAWIFFLGYRGQALIPLVVVLALLNKRGFRLPKAVYLCGLVVLLAAIPAMRNLRDLRLRDRLSPEIFANLSPWAAVEEMGGSLGPLVHTLRFLENEPLRWGKTYWRAAGSVIPNLSVAWQGRTYIPLEELPPTHWVTRQADPWKYERFGGLGFSAVAEPYMNFGAPGVAAYFFGLGFLLTWADSKDRGRPTRLAMWAVVLGPLLWTTRGSFHSFFRPAVWGLAGILITRLVADSYRASRETVAVSSVQAPS